jgi:hypothetical protein
MAVILRIIAVIEADGTAMFASDQPNIEKEKNEKPKSVFQKVDGAGDGAHVFGRFERHAR